jgi:hypothetical protein
LQLLYGAFRPTDHRCDLTNALFLDESHLNDSTLYKRQPVHELKQDEAAVEILDLAGIRYVSGRTVRIAAVLPSTVGDGICRNPKQPRDQWDTAPFEPAQMSERLLEDFGCDVLGGCAIMRTAADKRVDTIDVPIVQLGELGWISLRHLNQMPLIVCARRFPEI